MELINKNCPSGHNTTDHSSFIHVSFDNYDVDDDYHYYDG